MSALAVGGLYVGFLGLPAAAAAFTSKPSVAGSSFATGSVVLSDDDSGSALFAAPTDVLSTTVSTQCIAVTYSGTATPTVKLYGTVGGDSGAFSSVTLKIEEGTGGTTASCGSFSATSTLFNSTLNTFTATSYAAAMSTALTSGTKSYRFSLSVNGGASISLQGSEVSLAMTWEARAGS